MKRPKPERRRVALRLNKDHLRAIVILILRTRRASDVEAADLAAALPELYRALELACDGRKPAFEPPKRRSRGRVAAGEALAAAAACRVLQLRALRS
jgi:hypothetical protein